MLCLGDVNANSTVRIPFNTNAVAGESITIGTNGTIAIYKDSSTTERTSANGVTFVEDHDGHTGTHLIVIDLSDNTDAGFFAAGSDYIVKYHTATIDGKSISAWVGQFSIDKTNQKADVAKWLGTAASTPTVAGVPNVNVKTWNDLTTVALPLVPTTAGRTLDVSAGGEAGIDWANVGTPGSTVNLSATTIATTQQVDVNTIKTQAVTCAAGVTVGAFVGQGTAAIGVNASGHVSRVVLTDTATNLTNTVTLANGAHGGTSATLRLGGSSSTPAFYVTNSGGTAVQFESTGSDGNGVMAVGNGSGSGEYCVGGANGSGSKIMAGGGDNPGILAGGTGSAAGIYGAGSTSGPGMMLAGAGAGAGLYCFGGASGHGLQLVGNGAGDGLNATGGASGQDIDADIAGNITGNLVGTVSTLTTYTGNTPQTGDSFARIGATGSGLTSLASQASIDTINTNVSTLLSVDRAYAKNVAVTAFMFPMLDSSGDPATGKTVTAQVSGDGGAFATLAGSVSEVSGGWYKVNIAQAEMNYDEIALKFTATGCRQLNVKIRTQS